MTRIALFAVALAGLCGVDRAGADDPWELGADDAAATTQNLLRHGVVQRGHDLQGAPPANDRDWLRAVVKERHSYEARVSGTRWREASPAGLLPEFDLVEASGAVVVAGAVSNEDVNLGPYSAGRTLRWIANANQPVYLRALAGTAAPTGAGVYDVAFLDTTLFVPRWNSSATQSTVIILQNVTNIPVSGSAYFHDGAGALLATVPVSVPRNGVQLLSTASIPALAGQSGSAQVAHLGGYQALVGKAVALEPATGFTFDTLITPVAR
jgi:hypothetical protein